MITYSQVERCATNSIPGLFNVTPAVAILGPRQCGKTTLSRKFAASENSQVHFFDLENPVDVARLENPMLTLEPLRGLIVIDEVQLAPDLFTILRVLIDRKLDQRFLILGSASRDLIQHTSESLAGRISYIELTPFTFGEIQQAQFQKHWIRGGFPRSFLAESDEESFLWRDGYIRTFLERDIPQLGITIPARTLRRFWMMLAHYHGQILNASELGRSFGVADTTIRSYLDILTGTFMIRELNPWFANIGKRQVKSPKIYFRDSGIFHSLLGLKSHMSLSEHPKLGASWEGYALEEVIRFYDRRSEGYYFWAVHQQVELDLLVFSEGKRLGFEFKYSDAPTLSKSMIKSVEYLKLDSLIVVYPGKTSYPLEKKIEVMPIKQALSP